MKRGTIKGQTKTSRGLVKAKLQLMSFIEDGVFIAYIPALDISGYGKTEKDAHGSLSESLNNYFQYAVNKNTLVEDLKLHGWTIKKRKAYVAPEITDLINKNEYLHDVFNTKDFSFKRIEIDIPELA